MRILYVTQYFPPETGAGARRAFEMASAWRSAGHKVTVVAPFPSYPAGRVDPAYRGRVAVRERVEGIPVIRVPIYASPQKSFARRIGNYGSFAATGALAALLGPRADVVYVTSPPLPVGLAGLVTRLKGARLFFEVRDLWPESARALGELNNAAAYRAAEAMERSFYRAATRVVVVTQGIRDRLIARGVPAEKIVLAPNGAALARFAGARTPLPPARERLEVFYGGLLGLAQGIPAVIEGMRALRADRGVHFTLAGTGPHAAALEAAVAAGELPNVTYLGSLAADEVPRRIAQADVCLVPLAKDKLFEGALPSKIFEAWACGRPVLLTASGEAARLVARTGAGVVAPPEDPGSLAEAAHWLAQNRQTLVEMSARASEAVLGYDRGRIALELLRAMEAAA